MDDVNIFRQLLICNSVRGIDGTGIVKVMEKDGFADWRKQNSNPFDLLKSRVKKDPPVIEWLTDAPRERANILIGHNRFATVGDKSTNNAHPFTVDHITLVHNGCINNIDSFPESTDFEVDSHALTNMIAKIGLRETIRAARGAYAICYWDRNARKLNFIRNHDRPLSYVVHQKRLIWASEPAMLYWICARNLSGEFKVEILPPHSHMEVDLTNKEVDITFTSMKPRYKSVSSYANHKHANYGWENLDDNTTTEADTTVPLDIPDPEGDWEWHVDDDGKWFKKEKPKKVYVAPTPPSYNNRDTNPSTRSGLALPWPKKSKVTNLVPITTKKAQFPDKMLGFTKNEQIVFSGIEYRKSSDTQEQYEVRGMHAAHEALIVLCYVKGETEAKKIIDTDYTEATIRSMERNLISGNCIIRVTDPQVYNSLTNTPTKDSEKTVH